MYNVHTTGNGNDYDYDGICTIVHFLRGHSFWNTVFACSLWVRSQNMYYCTPYTNNNADTIEIHEIAYTLQHFRCVREISSKLFTDTVVDSRSRRSIMEEHPGWDCNLTWTSEMFLYEVTKLNRDLCLVSSNVWFGLISFITVDVNTFFSSFHIPT